MLPLDELQASLASAGTLSLCFGVASALSAAAIALVLVRSASQPSLTGGTPPCHRRDTGARLVTGTSSRPLPAAE
jgi:hypothetical protein